MLQQCSGGDGNDNGVGVGAAGGGGGVDGGPGQHLHRYRSSRDGQCAAAVHHAQSPRLSRDNKLRILGCKQSCLLLPAVQPVAAEKTTAVTTTTMSPPPPPPPLPRNDSGGGGGGGSGGVELLNFTARVNRPRNIILYVKYSRVRLLLSS